MKKMFMMVFTVISTCSFAQQWVTNLGGNEQELSNEGVYVNAQGNIMYTICGLSENGTITDTARGGLDVNLHILNQNGTVLMQKTFGGPGDDFGDILPFSENYLLYGYTDQTGGDVPLTMNGGSDIWVMLLSADYEVLWSKTFGGTGDEYPTDIYVDENNRIHMLFVSESDSILGIMNPGDGSTGVLCLNAEGDVLDVGLINLEDVPGVIGLKGYSFAKFNEGYFLLNTAYVPNDILRSAVVQFDNDLNFVNYLMVDDFASDTTYTVHEPIIIMNNPNNLNSFKILTSKLNWDLLMEDDPAAFISVHTNLIFNSADSAMSLSAHVLFPSEYYFENMKTLENGDYMFLGSKKGETMDAFALQMDSQTENIVDSLWLNGNYNDYFSGIVEHDSAFILTGLSMSNDSIFLNYGNDDCFVAKFPLENALFLTEEAIAEIPQIFPNPTRGFVNLGNHYERIEVYNSSLVIVGVFSDSDNVDLSTFSPGLYYLKIDKSYKFIPVYVF